MKREIKFRAWIKKDGQMFNQGNQYLQSFLKRCVRLSSIDAPSEHEKYGDYELMQFTGLIDKNGVEIYEGDIFRDEDGSSLILEYDVINSEYVLRIGKTQYTEALNMFISNKMEVIGNIHENPELL